MRKFELCGWKKIEFCDSKKTVSAAVEACDCFGFDFATDVKKNRSKSSGSLIVTAEAASKCTTIPP